MRYFRIHQDERKNPGLVMNGISLQGIQKAMKGDLSLLDDLTVMRALSYEGERFTELLDRQVFMYREKIKEVFDLYDPNLEYKNFCLLDTNNEKQHMYYYAPVLKIVPAISSKNKKPFDTSSLIYLDQEIVNDLDGLDIFRLTEPEGYVIVSLTVAESLLRRRIPEILLTHIEMV